MTDEEVHNEMSNEITLWFNSQNLVPMCAEEALYEYGEKLSVYQRNYLCTFISRWEAFDD